MSKQEQQNNGHYSEQNGHRERGIINKAMQKARENGIPLSRGETFVTRRFMMRSPSSGKNRRS